MKTYLSLALEGRDWWKPYLPYWLLVLILEALSQLLTRISWGLEHPGLLSVLSLVLGLGVWFVGLVFTIVVLRIVAPKLAYEGEGFSFRGRIGEFIGLNVVGLLLSIITLSIYLPWYIRRVTAYLASNTSYRGAELQFMGRGGRLFVRFLAGFWAPLIAYVAAAVILGAFRVAEPAGEVAPGIFALLTSVYMLYIFVVLMYLLYKWYVDIQWKDVHIAWKTHVWPSMGFILGQILLTIITATVYWPAAVLRIYRYFARRTVLARDGSEFARLAFDGEISKGFGLLWGQALLSLITLGFYAPWAYSRVGRWLVGATSVETTGAEAGSAG